MRDGHTYRGTPIVQVHTADIYDLLGTGIQIIENTEFASNDEALNWIKLRLEVELIRRSLGLEIRRDV